MAENSVWKTLGVNTGVATGVVAVFIGLGAVFRDWVTPLLADQVFGLSDHVIARVRDSKEIVDEISAAVQTRTMADIVGKIDAGYSISVNFKPVPDEAGGFPRITEKRLVAFHAKKGQRVCVAQQSVFRGIEGQIDIKIDGKPWKAASPFEDWHAPTDVTSLVSFDSGLQTVHIHEVELSPNLTVNEDFAALRAARGGPQYQPTTIMKLVILVYKGDQRECLE